MKTVFATIAIILQVISVAYAAPLNEKYVPKLTQKDFVTSAPTRIELLRDQELRREVQALINDAYAALKFDSKGECLPTTSTTIKKVRKATSMLKLEVNTGKRALTVTKFPGGVDIVNDANQDSTGTLRVGLFGGQITHVVKLVSGDSARVMMWNKKENKFDEKLERSEPARKIPELAKTTVWPQLPSELTFDDKTSPEAQEKLKTLYRTVASFVNLARQKQSEADYKEFSRAYYGDLHRQGEIERLGFVLFNNGQKTKSVTATYPAEKRITIQFDPIMLQEFHEGHATVQMRIEPDGRVAYCSIE